jgi:hypothetical protein
MALQALDFFQQGRLELFDPPTLGDQACQLRAIRMLTLANKPVASVCKRIVSEVNPKIDEVEKQIASGDVNLTEFRHDHDLTIMLDEELSFIIACFVLQKLQCNLQKKGVARLFTSAFVKPLTDNQFPYPKGEISKNLLTNMSEFLAKKVSSLAVNFIMNGTAEEKMALLCVREDKLHRMTVSCFFGVESIINVLLSSNSLVLTLIKADSKGCVLFRGDQETKKFAPITIDDNAKLRAAFIIEGNSDSSIADVKAQMIAMGLEKIFLLNAAQHPQFASGFLRKGQDGQSIESDTDFLKPFPDTNPVLQKEKQNFFELRGKAHEFGCSDTNKSLFLIEHIFAATIGQLVGVA